MKPINIKGNDEFELKTVLYTEDEKGQKRLCANYVMLTGPKGSLEITFEGFAINNPLRIKPKYKFASLCRMFDDRRLYYRGVSYIDGQFGEKKVLT